MNIQEFSNNDEMTATLAADIVKQLAQAISTKGEATLLVSGGKSPIALFKQLSGTALDWSKVTVSLVDDRWLDTDNDDSNERLVKTHLLVANAAAARFISLVGSDIERVGVDAQAGVAQANERVGEIANNIDVMVLGMGEDGHTASIFPCSAQVTAAMAKDNSSPLIATLPTTAPYQRISFTLNQILAASKVYLPLAGSKKLAVFELARGLENNELMPISAVIQQHQALDVLMSR